MFDNTRIISNAKFERAAAGTALNAVSQMHVSGPAISRPFEGVAPAGSLTREATAQLSILSDSRQLAHFIRPKMIAGSNHRGGDDFVALANSCPDGVCCWDSQCGDVRDRRAFPHRSKRTFQTASSLA